jgi:hypothetical protein
VKLTFKLTEENINYLSASARIRRTSKQDLIRRVIGQVLDDQLILAVLDDEREVQRLTKMYPSVTRIGRHEEWQDLGDD